MSERPEQVSIPSNEAATAAEAMSDMAQMVADLIAANPHGDFHVTNENMRMIGRAFVAAATTLAAIAEEQRVIWPVAKALLETTNKEDRTPGA